MTVSETKGLSGHNASPQEGVAPNPDPVLEFANEHHHAHLHHGGLAANPANHPDEVVYSTSSPQKSLDKPHDYSAAEKSVTDEESGNIGHIGGDGSEKRPSILSRYYRKYRAYVHLFIWLVFTAWWIFGLVRYRNEKNWLIPFLLYLAITLRIIFLWVPVKYVMMPVKFVWRHTAFRVYEMLPAKLHRPLAALVTIAVFLIGSMVPEEEGENTRARRAQSLFGLVVMIFVLTISSRNWRQIPWHTVIGGMLTQFIVAVFVLRTQAGYDIFNFISTLARLLLGFANDGVTFLTNSSVPKLGWFFTGVIPPIIFFVALVALCYHVGLIQWFVSKFAVFFFWTLRVSGAEAVVASATPFIGQGESAMLVRPFVPHMTLAEIHQVMTCGFATIAGSVLVAYIGLGINPQALVSSCIMSIPASLAVSKMRWPETEETLTSGRVVVPDDEEHRAANALHAFANGAWLGLKIAGMIVATLLCIIAFVALANGLLTWWGGYWGISNPDLTIQFILGYCFYPLSWLLGVPNDDLLPVGELIGQKIIINEFAAFGALQSDDRYKSMSERAKLIATYACCGFGNVGSLGTQIGVLSQLAPSRAGDVSKVAISALISGIISTLTSASVAGMLYTDSIGSASYA
ncbi:H+/nucleoside cotransporter-like protein [Annulohypoxylon maeteangense]|uniref:H+/nucleoside cotransporter-like protein n=1 Tax=Annulohypoxylon maeteangense TaxID=1927788 RepID=UPI0020087938|nr:H+/nucleoside cotransporter-like protein [Annulohypoxylon maeteangense]KAI0882948.1 H+/nucleoside cotransporter-like protein [Annulohypoxylon maeteangense]